MKKRGPPHLHMLWGPSTNIRLWKCLGITPTKTSFEHLVSGEQIYMFADVPHLLKFVRNNLLNSGFILPNQTYVGKQVLQEVVGLNKGDLSCVYKVTDLHLNVVGSQRQNVKLQPGYYLIQCQKQFHILAKKMYCNSLIEKK
jgi:hypothetical protein